MDSGRFKLLIVGDLQIVGRVRNRSVNEMEKVRFWSLLAANLPQFAVEKSSQKTAEFS